MKKQTVAAMLAIMCFAIGAMTGNSDEKITRSMQQDIFEHTISQGSGCPCGEYLNGNTRDDTADNCNVHKEEFTECPAELEVHFLDVGQGDSILISFTDAEGNAEYAMIDCGDNDKGTAVQKYLMDHDVNELEYLILTHPDADHIGGADVIISKFDINHILMSGVKNDTRTYEDVINAISYRGYEQITYVPEEGETLPLGAAKMTIMAAPNDDYGDRNNASIVIKLEYGSVGYLFMADAEYEEEMDLIRMYEETADLDVDILKVGHHGSQTSSNEGILDLITPEYAVISCGEGNAYHHPHQTALTALEKQGLSLYRTDEQGNIISRTDGIIVEWETQYGVQADWDRGADAGANRYPLWEDDYNLEI